MFYFAHNVETDAIISSPSFKRVFNAVQAWSQYLEAGGKMEEWNIYRCPGEYDKTGYSDMLKYGKKIYTIFASFSELAVYRIERTLFNRDYYYLKNRHYRKGGI